MDKQVFKEIEYYLYNYKRLDEYINELKEIIFNIEYSQNYSKWIKTTSSQLEEQVIRNINLELKIKKLHEWKQLITLVIEEYKKVNKLYYSFIDLKYIQKVNPLEIENKLYLKLKERKDMQADIVLHIFLYANKRKLIKKSKWRNLWNKKQMKQKQEKLLKEY